VGVAASSITLFLSAIICSSLSTRSLTSKN
jgi:hypothetical protein